MKFGYARVSTKDQNLSLQLDALQSETCDDYISEKISSRHKDRPEWDKLLQKLRAGDTLIVYKLDRIARSTTELLQIVEDFQQRNISLKSMQEPWADTTSSVGKLIITVMAGIAEFERNLIRQRSRDGRDAAKKRGVKFGRPRKLSKSQSELILGAYASGATVSQLAESFGVGRDTIYRLLKSQTAM